MRTNAGATEDARSTNSCPASLAVTSVGVGGPSDPGVPGSGGLGALVLPLLIAGVPALLIIAILLAQAAGGVTWLTLARRWLNRRVAPTLGGPDATRERLEP